MGSRSPGQDLRLIYTLAKRIDGVKPNVWDRLHGFARYFGSSIKGQAEIDWDDEEARKAFLQSIVVDADRLLEIARETLASAPRGSKQEERVRAGGSAMTTLTNAMVCAT